MTGRALLQALTERVNGELSELGRAALFDEGDAVLLIPHNLGPIWVLELFDGEDGFAIRGGVGLAVSLVADDSGEVDLLYDQVRGFLGGTVTEYLRQTPTGTQSIGYEYVHHSGGGSEGIRWGGGVTAVRYPAWSRETREEEA